MKSTKKLIIAAFMLVFAFVAAVSSTFAWFTLQNEVDVNNITLNVGAAGKDLQISSDGTTFGYSVNFAAADVDFELLPVTYIKPGYAGALAPANSFQELQLVDALNPYFAYTPTTAYELQGTYTEGDSYLVYDIWFKSSQNISVYLNTTISSILASTREGSGSLPQDSNILGAIRVMFRDVTDTEAIGAPIIWEPFTAIESGNTGTYGTGAYFVAANNYIAFDSFKGPDYNDTTGDDWLSLSGGTFSLTSLITDGEYASATVATGVGDSGDTFDGISLGTLNETVSTRKFQVTIWVEGWDGDANNAAALSQFASYLQFKGF